MGGGKRECVLRNATRTCTLAAKKKSNKGTVSTNVADYRNVDLETAFDDASVTSDDHHTS